MLVDVLWTSYVMAVIGHVCRKHCEIVANVFTKVIPEFCRGGGPSLVNSDPGITLCVTIMITHLAIMSGEVNSFVCVH
jgi:hypothetical protein